MKYLYFFTLLIFQNIFSQTNKDDYHYNSINFEFFGHSEAIISLNYERLFFSSSNKFIYGLKTGIGRNPAADSENKNPFPSVTTIPVVGTILYGGNNHFTQFSIAHTSLFSKNFIDNTYNNPKQFKKYEADYSISLGYRYMSKEGIIAQGYPMLIWRNNEYDKFSISFGVSLGYAF